MFSGFKSRWETPTEWRNSSAPKIYLKNPFASSSLSYYKWYYGDHEYYLAFIWDHVEKVSSGRKLKNDTIVVIYFYSFEDLDNSRVFDFLHQFHLSEELFE